MQMTFLIPSHQTECSYLHRTAATDASRLNESAIRIQIFEIVGFSFAQVRLRLLVPRAESFMVIFDNRIEQFLEDVIRIRVRSVQTNAAIQVFHAYKHKAICRIVP